MVTLFPIVPLVPTGFSITRMQHTMTDTTLTFEWDPPQLGLGAQSVVDNYTFIITPDSLSHPDEFYDPMSPLDVTVAHDTDYDVVLLAYNCEGESDPSVILDIHISE